MAAAADLATLCIYRKQPRLGYGSRSVTATESAVGLRPERLLRLSARGRNASQQMSFFCSSPTPLHRTFSAVLSSAIPTAYPTSIEQPSAAHQHSDTALPLDYTTALHDPYRPHSNTTTEDYTALHRATNPLPPVLRLSTSTQPTAHHLTYTTFISIVTLI